MFVPSLTLKQLKMKTIKKQLTVENGYKVLILFCAAVLNVGYVLLINNLLKS